MEIDFYNKPALRARAQQLAVNCEESMEEADRLEGTIGESAGVDAGVRHTIAHERQMAIAAASLGLLYLELSK